MKTTKDPRHIARRKLLEYLYIKKVNPQSLPPVIENPRFDQDLYNKILKIIEDNNEELDHIIEKYAKRDIGEIKEIEYVILKIAFAESYLENITPLKVATDEAIELAKEYSDDKSALFISGVVGALHSKPTL
jgi:N utilization substance protein B